ncbi:hypothetical protein [Telluribacter sp.]|uniref:hypothetical protein n=1 Tax=Telluribacter sp. TaxID=1978767 RepID=UPI002E162B9D|nr:hypothetical protein [Telluribacter sp.]
MTDVSTKHPSGLPFVELTDSGRKISFRRDCLGEVMISRTVDGGEEKLLVEGIRPPYTDQDDFPVGSHITYTIKLDYNQQKHQYTLEVWL